jgi:hypothetical protein
MQMKLFCSCGLRCLMSMVLLLVAVVLPGKMMQAQPATTTTLAVSPSSSPGSPLPPQTMVTLTATVETAGTAVSPGLVTFCDATATNCTGLAVLGTAQLTSAGTAVLRFFPGSGSHSYQAVFAGTTTHTASTSTPQSLTVSVPSSFPTTTSIASSGSPGNYTLTATIVGIGNPTQGPTGNVDFVDTTDNNRLLGTATLGAATLARNFANTTGPPIAVGTNPNNVGVGDFNGDGIPDLAVPNPGSNNVSILLGNGNGTFTEATGSPVPVGNIPLGVAVGDFNGDGITDLALANFEPNTVSVLLGNGDGTFSAAAGSPVPVGANPDYVVAGDFNGDGIPDLAVANSADTTVSILLGDGSGGFTELPRVAVGILPRGLAVGDFNGDGIADLEVANEGSNSVSILLGNGDGSFGTSQVAVGNSPFGVAVGYFNSDGFADLAVTNLHDNTVSILMGDGHGGFTQATGSPFAVGNIPRSVSVGDFNSDGFADLAITDSNDNEVRILLGNGLGSFTQATDSPIAVGGRPYGVSVDDFNGDGIADLAVANLVSATVSILLGQVTQTTTATLTGVNIPGSATHEVYATYPETESAIFNGSTSPPIPLAGSPVATTTTLLLSTADTIMFGTPVTLTAYVEPHTANGLTATGTVEFFDGASSLGTTTISAIGVASFTVPAFAVAVRSLTAEYHPGDTNFLTSTSTAVSLTVNQAQIAVSLISSQNPSVYGQTVMFTATVPSGATGTIQFRNGAVNLGAPVTIASGVAAIATTSLITGTHSIIAEYSGDASHLAAPSDVLAQLVTPAILTVTANNSTRTFNQPNAPLNYTITGFVGSDTQASSVTGTPTLLTTATEASPVGSYPVVIGLGSLASSNYSFVFVNGSLTVTRATPGAKGITPIILTSSINPSPRSESVTFIATVPARATGQVTFMDGAAVLGTATIFGQTASFSTSQLTVATHPITAVYGGDANFDGATSAVLSQVVNLTTLKVIANDTQRVFGQPNPALTTTITGFVAGDTQAVVMGAPSLTTTATPTSPVGVYPIVVAQGTLSAANYLFAFLNGTLNVMPATPGVGPTAPVTIASSLNPVPFGSTVILTVTVPTGATGTVTFDDGTTVLGTATITGNTASLNPSALAVGTHLITAIYNGDANFTAANSVVLSQVVVSAADFTVASTPGRQLIPPGESANITIVVSSINGLFTNPVTLSASSLPPGATYSFSPAVVTPGAAGANTTLTVSIPPQSSMASHSRRLGPIAFALLLLPFAYLKRYRREPQRLLLWMLVGLASLGTVSGCGEGGYFSQPEQTYTITVTGTSGALVRTTTVALTVE